MAKNKQVVLFISATFLALILLMSAAWAAEEYQISFKEFADAKNFYDDPRPFLKTDLSLKKVLPPEVYARLTYDTEAMKNLWAEVVGFRAPEVVGKIAPEIKPGKYSCQDKDKYPGLKELMIPMHYERFKPGEPPFIGNFPEIEIVPTKQYYYALPIAEATKKYMGTVKQDDQGYMDYDTYLAGFPFPRPSGPHKAIQIMYNWEKRYLGTESYFLIEWARGYDKRLKEDYDGSAMVWRLKLNGRATMPPYGWFDERARARGEDLTFLLYILGPRDQYGNVIATTKFQGLNDYDQFLLYLAMFRRVRKLSGTDTQDIAAGSDWIYEDYEGFAQKLSPNRFPYKYEVIGEREYLLPSYSEDGAEYIGSKGVELRNFKFERRPCYVVQMTQLDKGFVYGKRIFYIDAETFLWRHVQNFDQKGRLYRSADLCAAFVPEMGNLWMQYLYGSDHLDYHGTMLQPYVVPAEWITRDHVSMRNIVKRGK
jgi:hypothetical protein